MSGVQLPVNGSDFDARRGLLPTAVQWVTSGLAER